MNQTHLDIAAEVYQKFHSCSDITDSELKIAINVLREHLYFMRRLPRKFALYRSELRGFLSHLEEFAQARGLIKPENRTC